MKPFFLTIRTRPSLFPVILAVWLLLVGVSCSTRHEAFDASGVFEATEVMVSAEASGKIMQLRVEEGALVVRDSAVGYVDTMQLYLRKLQLLASRQAVQSRMQDVPRQVAALQQQILAEMRERERTENLLRMDAANRKQLDDITTRIAVLEKQMDAQKVSLTGANRALADEGAALEVEIARTEDQIRKSAILSPITGTVLVKYAEEGEYAMPGKGLFAVAKMDEIFLRAYLPSALLTKVQLGQEAVVWSDYGEQARREYRGRVAWISDKAEFTPKTIQTREERVNLVYAVKIAVKNDGFLKIGMYGEVKF